MFSERLEIAAARVAGHLRDVLAGYPDQPVVDAMRYAVQGGKRLRAFLVMEGAALHGVAPEQAVQAAAAVEALHAYSLVHDDLPCMDDDDLRRGLPTVHVKWDQATAVLVGDALQTLAFDLLADARTHPDPAVRIALVSSLARASGAAGMVLGQAQDIAAETGLEHRPVADAQRVAGIYRRSVMLASGRYAMLDDSMGFSLVPWRPVIEQRLGQQIAATMRGGGVSWEIGRQRAPSIS